MGLSINREKVIKKAERIMCSRADRDMIDSFCEDVIVLLEEQDEQIKELRSIVEFWKEKALHT